MDVLCLPVNLRYAMRVIGVCLLMDLLCCSSCKAQQAKTPSILPTFFDQPFAAHAQSASFADVVALIRKTIHVNLMVDGELIQKKVDIEFAGTLRQGLDQIAQVFDLEWTPAKNNVVLMNKRFHKYNEHPQTSLPEAKQIARDMIKALRTVAYDPDPQQWPVRLQTLVHSLTPAQAQMLRGGQKLSATSLDAGQQNTLSEIILGATFAEPLNYWQQALEQLDMLPASSLQAQIRGGDPLDPKVPRMVTLMRIWRQRTGDFGGETLAVAPLEDKAGRSAQRGK